MVIFMAFELQLEVFGLGQLQRCLDGRTESISWREIAHKSPRHTEAITQMQQLFCMWPEKMSPWLLTCSQIVRAFEESQWHC